MIKNDKFIDGQKLTDYQTKLINKICYITKQKILLVWESEIDNIHIYQRTPTEALLRTTMIATTQLYMEILQTKFNGDRAKFEEYLLEELRGAIDAVWHAQKPVL